MSWALESIKSFHLNKLLLTKAYIVWAKKVKRSYFPWNSIRIQNLERYRLVVSKLTCGIWQILTWALQSLKNFHFNNLPLTKGYIVWAKKVKRSYHSWKWRGIQNLERNRLVVSKLHKESEKFWPEHLKVSKFFTSIISFWPKHMLFELKM